MAAKLTALETDLPSAAACLAAPRAAPPCCTARSTTYPVTHPLPSHQFQAVQPSALAQAAQHSAELFSCTVW